ncbi:histidine phosphatase superfamily [Leptodontidium sp. 2 PMI_412]|nr:histidine phosphatase superfamily [Leptodontidium sp. MPI-SDFR-AT-0119]KAH9217884.1 histidine phosphatase superfamily [Leptodontidium sp. 2 PMI_412]
MRLLLIRHGETVHNVASVYAGVTDSALTNHGVLQANRLAAHLAATNVKISHIFSSDLQRAFKTAEAIRVAQSTAPTETTKLEVLREQDFGFYEGKSFIERPRDGNKSGKAAHQDEHRNDPGFTAVESKDSMKTRSDTFIDMHLSPLLKQVPEDGTVAVVAHGIILSHLWRTFLKRFHPSKVSVGQGIDTPGNGFSLEHLGGWSNTGYLDLEVKSVPAKDTATTAESTGTAELAEKSRPSEDKSDLPQNPSIPPPTLSAMAQPSTQFLDMSLVVRAVNSKEHLIGLKKTRGGIGSLQHDASQKTVDSFFKKRRTE